MATKKPADSPKPDKPGTKKTRWTVGRGSAVVKIYLTPHGDSHFYTLSYWLDGKRKRQVFPTLKKARLEAGIIGNQMTKGDLGSADLTNADRASYQRAITLLRPVGVPLELAASEYAAAKQRLGSVSLSEAVDYYMKRHPVHRAPKKTGEVMAEIMAAKRGDKLSDRYLKQLEYDLVRFTKRFPGEIEPISGSDIDAWLRGLEIGPRTRNNLRNSVQALFNFAIARKYLPRDHDELDAVPIAKDADGEIEIFTPEEMTELLAVATPKQIPFLAIGAFAGVRHAELQRLSWSNLKEDAGIIEIRAGTAKTASRRVIPLLPNLAAWLAEIRSREGKLCPYANMVLQFVELTRLVNGKRREAWALANGVSEEKLKSEEKRARERLAKLSKSESRSRKRILPGADTAEEEGWAAFAWKHNALRHSFISYRVADVQNVAQVALEAGNSTGMIFKHYRELVRPADAKKWFAIAPKPAENVVVLPAAAA